MTGVQTCALPIYGKTESVALTLRLDTQAEIAYVKRGGILPYVLEGLAA